MAGKGQPKTGGRAVGTPNKATREFRATVTDLLAGNAHNVAVWLSDVADGNEDKGLKPDPGRALDLMAKLAEFAAPKLARVEHTGDPDKPVHTVNRIELVALDGSDPDSTAS